MRYELLRNSNAGIIIDSTPILRDIKDTFAVSFILPDFLPENGAYVALFRDENGIEYRTTICDRTAKIPKQLLTKEQSVGLTVCHINNDKIIHSWECASLKVGTFLSLRKTQWQITAGMDDKEIYARLARMERIYADEREQHKAMIEAFDKLQAEFMSLREETEKIAQRYAEQAIGLMRTLASVKTENENIAKEHNKAIQVINNLSQRLSELEKNYDPTIIN